MMATMSKETSCCQSRVLSNANTCVFAVGLMLLFTASVALTSMVPYETLYSSISVVEVFRGRGIEGMMTFAAVGATSCLFSSVIAAHFTVARILQEMANDGLLFSPLARVGSLRGTPWISAVVSGMTASVFAAFFDLKLLIKVLGVGTLVNSAAAPIAVLVLHYSVNHYMLPMNSINSWSHSHDISPENTTDKVDAWDNNGESVLCSRKKSLVSNTLNQEPGETTELLHFETRPSDSLHHLGMKLDSQTSTSHLLNRSNDVCQCTTENFSVADYGSIERWETSVEFGDEGFHTTLVEATTFNVPTMKSWTIFWIALLILIVLVLFLGAYAIYCWQWSSFYWHKIILCLSTFGIIAVVWMLAQQPRRHFHNLRNPIPCMPFLPLFTLSLHLVLMAGLPSVAWLRLSVWSFLGKLALEIEDFFLRFQIY